MKTHILLAGALAALTGVGAAQAADLPSRSVAPPPMPMPSVYSWTGFYLGVNAGYGIARDPESETTVSGAGFPILGAGTLLYGGSSSNTLSPDGFVGGGQIGYNVQFSPTWVAGLEADFQGSTQKSSQNCVITCNTGVVTTAGFEDFPVTFSEDSVKNQIDWFGTARGRLGLAAGPVLIYGTGGLAYGQVARSGSVAGTTNFIFGGPVNSFAGSFNSTSTKVGWTVGGGIEGQLTGNWSVKAEYLYVDLGKSSDSFNTYYLSGSTIGTPGAVAATRTISSTFRENVVRVGLNYKFSS